MLNIKTYRGILHSQQSKLADATSGRCYFSALEVSRRCAI